MNRYDDDRQAMRDKVPFEINLTSYWDRFQVWVKKWWRRRKVRKYAKRLPR